MLMMMVRNEDDDDDDDDDDDGEEARSKAMHESAFRSDAWRRVQKRGPYPKAGLTRLYSLSHKKGTIMEL